MGTFTIRNRTTTPIRVARFETSCPCVRVSPSSLDLKPDKTNEIRVNFDAAMEPNFRGRLAVDLTGLSRSGEVLFRSTVDLTVGKEIPIQTRQLEPIPQVSGSFPVSSKPSGEVVP